MWNWTKIFTLAFAGLACVHVEAQEKTAPEIETYAELETTGRAQIQSYRYQPAPQSSLMAGDHSWMDTVVSLSWGGYFVPFRTKLHSRYTGFLTSSPKQDPTAVAEKKLWYRSKFEELWLTSEIVTGLFLGLGKKKIEAGSGLFQSPSDLFGFRESKAILTEGAIVEGLIGVDLKFLADFGTLRYLYYPALHGRENFLEYISSPQDRWGHTVSLSSRIVDIDYSMLASYSGLMEDNGVLRCGANGSFSAHDSWTVRIDASLTERIVNRVVRGGFTEDETARWFLRLSLGLEFDPDSKTSLLGEYYYNGRGLQGSLLKEVLGSPGVIESYGPFGVSRHYVMERITRRFEEGFSLELLNVHSLDDLSGIIMFRAEKKLDSVIIAVGTRGFYGPTVSEFGSIPRIWDGMFEIRYILF